MEIKECLNNVFGIHSPSKRLRNLWENAIPYYYKGFEHGSYVDSLINERKLKNRMTCREKLKINHQNP